MAQQAGRDPATARVVNLYIGLLRAINVTGRNKVGMASLRDLLSGCGLDDPRSLLQSGNLVFGSSDRSTAELEGLLQTAARERLGLDTDFMVRTDAEWHRIVSDNPVPDAARDDPAHLVLQVLHAAVEHERFAGLQQAIIAREVVRGAGRHAYLVYPDGIGNSKLTYPVIARHLGVPSTGRNWNTVLKLAAMVA